MPGSDKYFPYSSDFDLAILSSCTSGISGYLFGQYMCDTYAQQTERHTQKNTEKNAWSYYTERCTERCRWRHIERGATLTGDGTMPSNPWGPSRTPLQGCIHVGPHSDTQRHTETQGEQDTDRVPQRVTDMHTQSYTKTHTHTLVGSYPGGGSNSGPGIRPNAPYSPFSAFV